MSVPSRCAIRCSVLALKEKGLRQHVLRVALALSVFSIGPERKGIETLQHS